MNDDRIPHSDFPDELISAYLDGELSADDRARVEEQLMDSVEHRRMFEELKSLRRSLQELPGQSLDDAFAARVLQRAEQELLLPDATGEAPPQAAKAAPTGKANSAGAAPPRRGEPGAWRGLVWSVAAMAAAVMFIVFSPLMRENGGRPGDRNVAVQQESERGQHAAKESSQADGAAVEDELAAGDAKGSHKERLGAARRDADARPEADASAENEANLAADGADRKQSRAHRLAFEADRSSQTEKGNRANNPHALADTRAAPASGNGAAADKTPSNGFGRGDWATRRPPHEAGAAADAPTSPGPESIAARDAEPSAGGNAVGERNRADARATAKRFAALPRMETLRQGGFPAARDVLPNMPADANATDMMVVSVDVTPEALSRHFMDDLLKKHDIHTDAAQMELAQRNAQAHMPGTSNAEQQRELPDRPATSPSEEKEQAKKDDGTADAPIEKPAPSLENVARRAPPAQPQRARTEKAADSRPHPGDVDVMVVVATAEQVERLLSDMQSQTDDVLAMAYDRPVAVSQLQQRQQIAASPPAPPAEANAHAAFGQGGGSGVPATGEAPVEADHLGRTAPDRQDRPDRQDTPDVATIKDESAAENASEGGDDSSAQAAQQPTPKSKVEAQEDEEQFRGIARRLHLPEDFRKTLTTPRTATADAAAAPPSPSPPEAADPEAADVAGPEAAGPEAAGTGGQRGEQQQDQGPSARADQPRADQPRADQPRADQPRADQRRADQRRADQRRADQRRADQRRADQRRADQRRAGPDVAPLAEAETLPKSKQGETQPGGKSTEQQPLVRVLFVLRAAHRGPQAPLAEQVPAAREAGAAALQESAPAEAPAEAPAATPGVDE